MSDLDRELAAAFGEDWEERLGGTYRAILGEVPRHVRERWAAVAAVGRPELIEAIEALRAVAIAENPLGLRVQQLVQFGQLLVLGHEGPARLHAAAAVRQGASLAELLGVAETAFITGGVAAFSLGVRLVDELRWTGGTTTPDVRNRAMGVAGIDHVMVVGPEGCEPEARAFYGELLGLEEIPRPTTLPDQDGCWFRVGAQQLHVGIARPFQPALKAHASFIVEDLAALIDHLAARGVEATRDDHIAGVDRAFIHDPFGNRLEIRQARRDG